MPSTRLSSFWRSGALLATLVLSAPALAHDLVVFDRDVQPIFQRSCGGGSCHINQSTNGVQLTTYQHVLSSVGNRYDGPIVVAGDPASSPLYEKVSSDSPTHGARMPPVGDHLDDIEINTVRRWIEDGLIRSHVLLRGDVDQSDTRNVTDVVLILDSLFRGGAPIPCADQSDANNDGATDVSDAIFLLRFLFDGGSDPGSLDEDQTRRCEETDELSFASLYEKVLRTSCAFSSCHSAETHRADLSFATLEQAYLNLVDVQPFNEVAWANNRLRVDPGRPENSFLLTKLTEPGPGEGNRMPSNSSTPLSAATVNGFREWILAGAPFEGTIAGVPDIDAEAAPPVERVPQPAIPENGLQIHLPPFTVAPHREREIFYFAGQPFADLDVEEVLVKRIDVHMVDSSHHFILYRYIGNRDPRPGVRNGSLNIGQHRLVVGSQRAFKSFAFPEGVGMRFARDTKFDLNSHYVNLNGEEPLQAEVYINIFFAEPDEITTFVNPIFDFGGDIFVPPHATTSADGAFPNDSGVPGETHVYALSSHTHRHGVRFEVWKSDRNGDIERVLHNLDWDDPEYRIFDPPLVLERGQRLRYRATYTYDDPPSDNAPPLAWGPTSEDEMIILLGYYARP